MTQRRPPKPPLVYRFLRDASGQSETVGTLLILSITVIGTTGIVVYGSGALTGIQDAAQDQRAEHTMTLLDSRGAMVALGDSNAQTVDFGAGSGQYHVRDDTGWLRIQHVNYTEWGDDEELYNESLGSVVYESGETSIAYQGGGVWRNSGNRTMMVSPPEFHYRGSTLTLPVIRVGGDGSGAGDVSAHVTSDGRRIREFANDGASYGNISSPYANPVSNGSIAITVKSEYYVGWADYFRDRTEGNVTVDHDNETASVELVTAANEREVNMGDDNPVEMKGLASGHSINEFVVNLTKGTAALQNTMYMFHADGTGGKEFELVVQLDPDSGNVCSDGSAAGDGDIFVDVYYYNGTGGPDDEHQTWTGTTGIGDESDGIYLDCNGGGDPFVHANLTSENFELDYVDDASLQTKTSQWNHDLSGTGTASGVNLSHHPGEDGEPTEFTVTGGETTNVSHLLNHYMALVGADELPHDQGTGGGGTQIDQDRSDGRIDFDRGEGRTITFLHVTENRIEVEIE